MRAGRRVHRAALDGGWLEVWETPGRRSLWFDDGILQSEIDLRDPGRLPNPANRAMLAHLLFADAPRRVLLAGCGGGGIARWFHHRSPATRGVAVEIDPAVARVAREWFDFPGPGSGWEIEVGDVRTTLAATPGRLDYLLVDLAEAGRTPGWVTGAPFLTACRQALSPRGVLAVNLIAEAPRGFARQLAAIRALFPGGTCCLGVPDHHNVIVFGLATRPEGQVPAGRTAARGRRWGLELDEFLQRMRAQNPPGSGIF